VGALKNVGHIVGGTIKRCRPYVVAEFKTHEPVFGCSNEGRLEQLWSELWIGIPEILIGPFVHLRHRGQPAIQRRALGAEDRRDRSGIGAGPAVIVQIGFGKPADRLEVFGFERLLKLFVHEGSRDTCRVGACGRITMTPVIRFALRNSLRSCSTTKPWLREA